MLLVWPASFNQLWSSVVAMFWRVGDRGSCAGMLEDHSFTPLCDIMLIDGWINTAVTLLLDICGQIQLEDPSFTLPYDIM